MKSLGIHITTFMHSWVFHQICPGSWIRSVSKRNKTMWMPRCGQGVPAWEGWSPVNLSGQHPHSKCGWGVWVLTLFFFSIPEAEPALEGNHQEGGEAVAQQPLFCRMNTSRLSPWTYKNRPGGPSNQLGEEDGKVSHIGLKCWARRNFQAD